MKAMLSSKAMRNHLLTMAKRKAGPEALSFRSISSFSDVLSQSNRAQRRLSSARPLPEEEELDVGEWEQPKRGVEKRPRFQFQLAKPLRQTSLSTVPQPAVFEEKENVEANTERESESPKELLHTEGVSIPITSKLHIFTPQEGPPRGTWPVFRLMDENGLFRNEDGVNTRRRSIRRQSSTVSTTNTKDLDALRITLQDLYPQFRNEIEHMDLLRASPQAFPDTDSNNTLLRAHRQMIRLREMDTILQNAQRQGRISFYMTCTGEEAIHIGAASALDLQDTVLAQYREAGLLMWRGFSLQQFTDQCFANKSDLGKGRQMPVHYGSRALNYHTISSPLGTQLPQAVGVAYRFKLAKKPNVAICFFGDGCASTPDFHSGMNFAATLGAPVIFFCRNNGYAISTPVTDQYAGDGIVSRSPGYGMAAIRIDGNDIFAVHAAVREAKKYALENQAPVLIEAMTYRRGHHSTSDDSTRYRSTGEIQDFAEKSDPIGRLDRFLERFGWMDDAEVTSIRAMEKSGVLHAMEQAERKPKPPLESMFEDVYYEVPARLKEQEQQLRQHMKKYADKY